MLTCNITIQLTTKHNQIIDLMFILEQDLTLALRHRKFVLNVGIAKLRLECKNAESGPINLPSDEHNPDIGDGNNSPNENAEKQT